jgi:hypothetical protein
MDREAVARSSLLQEDVAGKSILVRSERLQEDIPGKPFIVRSKWPRVACGWYFHPRSSTTRP